MQKKRLQKQKATKKLPSPKKLPPLKKPTPPKQISIHLRPTQMGEVYDKSKI